MPQTRVKDKQGKSSLVAFYQVWDTSRNLELLEGNTTSINAGLWTRTSRCNPGSGSVIDAAGSGGRIKPSPMTESIVTMQLLYTHARLVFPHKIGILRGF